MRTKKLLLTIVLMLGLIVILSGCAITISACEDVGVMGDSGIGQIVCRPAKVPVVMCIFEYADLDGSNSCTPGDGQLVLRGCGLD